MTLGFCAEMVAGIVEDIPGTGWAGGSELSGPRVLLLEPVSAMERTDSWEEQNSGGSL